MPTDATTKHKTTVKVRKSLWELFSKECKAASLRLDDLLNRTLPDEIAQLEAIPACDDEGERWLKNTWLDHCISASDALQTAPLILSLDVLERMNAACEAKRVPRDAFLDCALSFLTKRLYEAVIVIKNPRTTLDIAHQLHAEISAYDDALDDDDLRELGQLALDWFENRGFPTSDYYRNRLSYDKARVDSDRMLLASL